MFTDNVCGIGMDSKFDETEGRLDNLSIRGVEENHHRSEDFVGHFRRNVVCGSEVGLRMNKGGEGAQTFEFKNHPGDGGDRRADHMGGCTSETTSNHREVLFQRCGCYMAMFNLDRLDKFVHRGHTFRSVILVHPFKQVSFYYATLFHLLTHGDNQVESFEARLL